MATGKRNKEGRKRRKEQERVEYLDHQKRRLENYIKAEVCIPVRASRMSQVVSQISLFTFRRRNVKMLI